MYKYFVIVAVIAAVECAVVPAETAGEPVLKELVKAHEPVAILSQDSDASPEGSYKWSFEAADGTKAEQVAEVKTIDKDTVVEDVRGSYAYVDPEGKTHSVNYEANEHGFFPKGDDIFPEIASHLAQLEANPEPIEREVAN